MGEISYSKRCQAKKRFPGPSDRAFHDSLYSRVSSKRSPQLVGVSISQSQEVTRILELPNISTKERHIPDSPQNTPLYGATTHFILRTLILLQLLCTPRDSYSKHPSPRGRSHSPHRSPLFTFLQEEVRRIPHTAHIHTPLKRRQGLRRQDDREGGLLVCAQTPGHRENANPSPPSRNGSTRPQALHLPTPSTAARKRTKARTPHSAHQPPPTN